MTPAQASGRPDFVTDVPVQGPTDPGMRAAGCWWTQNVLPSPRQTACVDCKGPIPMWAQTKGLLGDGWGALEGVRAPGFALGGPGDPDIWSALNPEQQTWVTNTLTGLNDRITKSNGSKCSTWGSSTGSIACFQWWFNSTINPRVAGQPAMLRTDGAFDQSTLDALIMTAGFRPADFPTKFPAGTRQITADTAAKKGLSAGAMVGIAAVGAAAVGGGIYLATHGKKSRRR